VLTFQDLTKVRRLEFAMRQSEKLAAVGQLAAGIAHEIRNPLASISGSIQLLESSLPAAKDAEERKLMRIVLREIDRLNGLISEFLVYVRPDQAKDDPVDLGILTRETLDLIKLNPTLRQDVRQVATLEAGPGAAVVSGDRDKLRQAILNVVMNAYQAMGESSEPVIEASACRSGDLVQLKIRDCGVGIEESRLRKIFEPFHTTKPKGTGLGLAVTHKIVETHGGKIFVESAPGQGTEFTFEFPARASGREAGDAEAATEAAGGTGPDAGQNGLAASAQLKDDFKQNRKRGSG
jgi:two-component system sensor histidine kinase PilS (NtrC family)